MFSKRRSASSASQPSGPPQSPNPQSEMGRVAPASTTQLGTPRNSTATQPPRYSNLSSLASNVVEEGSEVDLRAGRPLEQRRDVMDDAIHNRISLLSLESNGTTPTYATIVPAGHNSRGRRSTLGESATAPMSPPRYSSMSYGYFAATPREFEYAIRGGSSGSKGQPWATLKLYDTEDVRGGKGGKHPRFCEGDNISGCVELSLSGPHTIKNIKLVLKGTIITSAMDSGSVDFLEQTYTIWDRSFGDPRQPRPEEKFDGKLEGDHTFPFSIPFPKYVNLSTSEAVQASGQPVDSQIQLPSQRAGVGGEIRAFTTESSVQKRDTLHAEDSNIGGASSDAVISPGSPPVQTDPGRGHEPHITPFHLGTPYSQSERQSSTAPLDSEPGPSAITPYTYRRDATPSGSTSKQTSRKESRWSFSKTSTRKPTLKANRSAPDELGFQGGHFYLISLFGGINAMHDLNPTSQITALKSEAPVVLPQSFLERDVKANTRYELKLSITHGRFSSSGKVNTTVVYNRTTIPPPMPWFRRDAYQERQALPSPMVDPESWQQLPTVSIKGMFLQQREMSVDYTLSLANPLSYARGTVIPCYLTISCDDVSALNLFSNPRSPRVRLTRVVRYLDSAGGSGQSPGFETAYDIASSANKNSVVPQVSPKSVQHLVQAQPDSTSNGKHQISGKIEQQTQKQAYSMNQQFHGGLQLSRASVNTLDDARVQFNTPEGDGKTVSTAGWWVPQEVAEDWVEKEGVRLLEGEIHLPFESQPSCPFPLFNISYRVELLAPISHAFEPDLIPSPKDKGLSNMDKKASENTQKNRVYASQSVEITTNSRDDEPDVIAFTEPPSRLGEPRIS